MQIDSLETHELLKLARSVIESCSDRNAKIDSARELRERNWPVPVPPAWRKTAKVFHCSHPVDIAHRVPATLSLRDPVISRTPPDEELGAQERSASVVRYFQGRVQQFKSDGVPGKNGWLDILDQMSNKGAACVACLWVPHAWTGPVAEEGKRGKRFWKPGYWRDGDGKPTTERARVDDAATGRHYLRVVDAHRRAAKPPVVWRVYPTECSFPLWDEEGLAAMVVERDLSGVQLSNMGFDLDSGETSTEKNRKFLEVWTKHQCLYFLGNQPALHRDYGPGFQHDYGFVPFAYREGLTGGDPLLSLVDGNIRMIDTLRTYMLNAIHFVSMPMIYMEYSESADSPYHDAVTEGKPIPLETGSIMDFGPFRRPALLAHPGVNKDMFEALKYNEEEIHRIIPRTLQGQAESSGYNTVQTSAQAKAIFNPILDGAELLLRDLCVMEMRHLTERPGRGAVYLDYAERNRESSARAKVRRVKLVPEDIGGYYGLDVAIDRQLDYITESAAANQLLLSGVVSKEYVAGKAGITDYQAEKRRKRLEEFEAQPVIAQLQMAKAARLFGVEQAQEEAAAQARIVPTPDGTPGVAMPDGTVAAPGQSPQMQGPAGALMGGANSAVAPGAANLGATANPNVDLPTGANPTSRLRNRGGARPGLPQRQPARPPAKPVV